MAMTIVHSTSAMELTQSALGPHGLARGVTVDGVMTAQVALNDPRYADTEQLVRVATSMLERLSTSPGIDAAALVNYPPLSMIRVGVPVTIEGQTPPPGQLWMARYWVAAPGYFHTAGIRLLDRKSTRLNSSHGYISYAVFCLKKKKKLINPRRRTGIDHIYSLVTLTTGRQC